MTAYFKEHIRITLLCFAVWLAGAVFGIYIPFGASAPPELGGYISDIALGGASFWRIFANGVSANAVFISLMLISSFFAPLIPLGLGTIAFKGFASGLGSAVLIRLFPSGGVWVALGALVLPLVFALPLQFMVFVSGMDTALKLSADKNPVTQKEIMRLQTVRTLLLFSALCLISAFDAVISPYIFLMLRT